MYIKGVSVLAVGVALACAAQPALAQEQGTAPSAPSSEGASGATSGDIIVTANRREQRLQDVPATVTVVTGEDITNLKLFRVEDIAVLSPGLGLDKGSGGFSAEISLRGTTWDTTSGSLPAIDVYYNDVILEPNIAFNAMYDIGQIEVLRGPQGTLRGRPSPAGAITIASRRPDLSSFGGYGSVTATSLNGLNLQGAVNVPLVTDRLAFRIAGLIDNTNADDVRSVNNITEPSSRTQGVRGSLRAELTETLDVLVTVDHLRSKLTNFRQVVGPGRGYNGPVIASEDRLAVQEELSFTDQNADEVVVRASQELPFGAELIYVGGYQQQKTQALSPLDSGNAITNYAPNQRLNVSVTYWTHELRLQSTGGGLFDYVLGAYSFSGAARTRVETTSPLAGAFGPGGTTGPANPNYILNIVLDSPGKIVNRALFANVTLHATDKLDIQGGVRYNTLRNSSSSVLSVSQGRTIVFPIANSAFCPFAGPFVASQYPGFCDLQLAASSSASSSATETFKPLTYDASVKYEVTPDVNVYARFGHSWRPPTQSLGLQAGTNPILAPLVYTGPETSNSFEVGFKATLLDKRLRLNVAAFQQDYKGYLLQLTNLNYISAASGQLATTELTYNADARIRGIEADAAFKATDNWDLSVTAAYAKSNIKNVRIPCRTANPATLSAANPISFCMSDQAISTKPNFSMTVQSEVRFPFGQNVAYLRGLAAYTGKGLNPNTGFRSDDYLLLNLFAGVRIAETAEVTLFAKNILNTDVELNRDPFDIVPVAGVTTGYRQTSRTAAREFGATIRMQWGSR